MALTYVKQVTGHGREALRRKAETARDRGISLLSQPDEVLEVLDELQRVEQLLLTAKVNVDVLADCDLPDDVREFVTVMAAELADEGTD